MRFSVFRLWMIFFYGFAVSNRLQGTPSYKFAVEVLRWLKTFIRVKDYVLKIITCHCTREHDIPPFSIRFLPDQFTFNSSVLLCSTQEVARALKKCGETLDYVSCFSPHQNRKTENRMQNCENRYIFTSQLLKPWSIQYSSDKCKLH